jgi:hypothetical protein
MMIREKFTNLNSASALMRFKSRNGLRKTKSATTCGYIALVGIKRVLRDEFTDDVFRDFIRENDYVASTRVGDDKRDRINKFLNKLDKMPYDVIEGIYKVYQDSGIKALVKELNKPIAILKRNQTEEE